MRLIDFFVILLGVLLNAAAQLFLKEGSKSLSTVLGSSSNFFVKFFEIIFNPFIFGGLSCYVISVGAWIFALSKVPVSIAYPLLSIGYVVNALAARFLFGEELTPQKITGIAIIIVGVVVVARA